MKTRIYVVTGRNTHTREVCFRDVYTVGAREDALTGGIHVNAANSTILTNLYQRRHVAQSLRHARHWGDSIQKFTVE